MSHELECLASFKRHVTTDGEKSVNPIILARRGWRRSSPDAKLQCCRCGARVAFADTLQEIELLHKNTYPQCTYTPVDVTQEVDNIANNLIPMLGQTSSTSAASNAVAASGRDEDDCIAADELPESAAHNTTNNSNFPDLCLRILQRGRLRFVTTSGSTVTDHQNANPPSTIPLILRPSEQRAQLQALNINRSSPLDYRPLQSAENRLLTFYDWPMEAARVVDPEELVSAGLFYTGEIDRVQCAYCRGYLRRWTQGDKPIDEHRKHFPQCAFVRGLPTSAGRDAVDNPHAAQFTASAASGHSIDTNMSSSAAVSRPLLSTRPPVHLEYADIAARKQSFDHASQIPNGQSINVLAEAGFYYVGPGDNVRCYYCDGGLKNWRPSDEPWTEHGRWFPRCPFLVATRDQTFVQNVQVPRNARLTGNLPANSVCQPPVSANNVQYRIEPREIKARMDAPLVRTVIGMGYQRDLVRKAVERRLTTTGDDFPNAESLLTAIFDLEESLSAPLESIFRSAASTAIDISKSAPAESFNTASTSVAATDPGADSAALQSQAAGAKKKKKKKKGSSPPLSSATPAAESLSSACPGISDLRTAEELEKLEEENRQLKEARTCRVCMDVEINTVFLPCGHLVCCDNCARSLQHCPICRAEIRGTVKTYLS